MSLLLRKADGYEIRVEKRKKIRYSDILFLFNQNAFCSRRYELFRALHFTPSNDSLKMLFLVLIRWLLRSKGRRNRFSQWNNLFLPQICSCGIYESETTFLCPLHF